MKMRTMLAAMIVTALLAPAMLLAAPSGEEVMDNYIKVTGGKEAYEKVKSRVTKNTLELPARSPR